MISSKILKAFAKEKNKKLSKEAAEKIEEILKNNAMGIISESAQKSEFKGRIVIKKEDISV